MPPKKKQDPRKQYFEAIKSGKLDTLRWCLRHGGISVRAEDDDGNTGPQLAAAGGHVDALQTLIENVRKVGTPSDLEEPDEEGRTPLMLAAHAGKLECCRLLVLEGKVKLTAKCEAGKTARDYAVARKQEKVVAFLDDPTKPPPEEEEEEEETAEEAERRRVFKASQKAAGQTTTAQLQEEVHRQRVEAAEALEKALSSSAPAVWPEVAPVLKETRRELSLKSKPPLPAAQGGPVDPAVWSCVCLFELRLEVAERALTVLPPAISRLSELVTLIVSGNALSALPAELATLTKLRNLEAAGNELGELPSALSQLSALQVLDVSNNKIGSLAPLSKLCELVSLNAGYNQIEELPLCWEKLEHMQTLAVPHNQIRALPAAIGQLQMLVTLDLANNAIEQVPMKLGDLTVKKLQAVKLAGNPLADARIRRFVEDDSPTLVKDLLNHVRKNGFVGEAAGGGKKGGGGGKKGKKGKGKAAAAAEEEEEGDGDASIAELLAAMGGGSDSDDDGKKAVNVS